MGANGPTPPSSGPNVLALITERIRQGMPKEAVVQELVGQGMEPTQAQQWVDAIFEEARKQTLTGGAVAGALIAGGVAAVISAAAWIALVMLTDRELGLVAWAIGGLVGFAVSLASGKRRGRPLQIIAAIWAFLGVAIAKGIMFALVSLGAEPGQNPVTMVFGGYDVLWVALAVITAWNMLRPAGMKIGPA